MVVALGAVLFSSTAGFSAPSQEEHFSTKGTITQIESTGESSQEGAAKILRVKTEGGLELTFRANNLTSVKVGEQVKSLADLAVNDPVEIDYAYNENYEKVSQSIVKKQTPEPPKPEKS